MREAIIKQNPETKLFVVCFYYKHDTPSGCERWILFASTNEITEPEAITIANEFNNKEKLSERQSG